eukprot:scaffold16612_cov109-Skeletonema_dohrnii-CCMP3373.AAC.3
MHHYHSSSLLPSTSLFHITPTDQHVVAADSRGQSMTSEKNNIETDGDDDYWMMVHLNLAIMLFNSTG